MTNEKRCLDLIIVKFKVYDVDWLNFKISKDNPLTYHHIIPRRNNGLTTENNGAPLTTYGHPYFHKIEKKEYIISKHITRLFQKLQESQLPPTIEYFNEIEFYKEKYEHQKIRIYKK